MKCSGHDNIFVGLLAIVASSGHKGIVSTKTPYMIHITPQAEWSSQTEKGLVGNILKGELIILTENPSQLEQ